MTPEGPTYGLATKNYQSIKKYDASKIDLVVDDEKVAPVPVERLGEGN